MKRIETQTNIDSLLQPLPETVQERICGGSSPAGDGGGGDILVWNYVDSVAELGGSGLVVPVKIKHGV